MMGCDECVHGFHVIKSCLALDTGACSPGSEVWVEPAASVSSGCITQWLQQQTFHFSQFWRLGISYQNASEVGSWLSHSHVLTVSSHNGERKSTLVSLLIKSLILWGQGSTFMTSLLPKSVSPNTVTLGVRGSYMNGAGGITTQSLISSEW